jgi:ribosome biogenesis GTPase / thiamine phosphate phosphatase
VPDLEALGWDDTWEAAFDRYRAGEVVPARVAVPHRGEYDVLAADGETRAHLPSRARRDRDPAELPVVGDWVALDASGPERTIQAVLPRRTKFSRRAAHEPGSDDVREQVVAANVDVLFVALPVEPEPSARVLERYLTLAWESGARPVVLLTKADLVADPRRVETDLGVVGDVPVHTLSTRVEHGLGGVRSYLTPGVTGALVGPSGAGKSTIVNAFAGEERLETGAVARDGSGRHTTTRRELILLPGGGLIVDNPGMRELHLWLAEDGLEDAFDDIAGLAADCRFSDCRHESEPGCAVLEAVERGELDPARLESYRDLQRELAELEESLVRRERSRTRRGRPDAGGSSA